MFICFETGMQFMLKWMDTDFSENMNNTAQFEGQQSCSHLQMQLCFTLNLSRTRFSTKKRVENTNAQVAKHSTDTVHCVTGDCQSGQREATKHKTTYLSLYKKRQPGNSASLAHAWVLRSGHTMSVTCMAEPKNLITTIWAHRAGRECF